MALLGDVVAFLDGYLRCSEIRDAPNAVNGLQVEAGANEVRKVALAVDAGEPTIRAACDLGADLLLVHHGLLWEGNRPFTGARARRLSLCFAHRLSVYSAHLPLDLHPEVGNNAELVRVLGLGPGERLGRSDGTDVGLLATCDLSREALAARIEATLGPCRWAGRGPDRIARIAVISGSGASCLEDASRRGAEALLTGEASHHAALLAEELGMHLLLAGHYRTETLGVKALGALLKKSFDVEATFLPHDTGL